MNHTLHPFAHRWSRLLVVLTAALLVAAGLSLTQAPPAQAAPGATVTNPLVTAPNSADPWLGFHDGSYYYVATTSTSNIVIRKSSTLAGLTTAAEQRVFTLDQPTGCCVMWAPDMQLLDGPNGQRWYLYYSADPSTPGTNRQTAVLESASDDPLGPYTYKGVLAFQANGGWAIDSSVLRLDGKNYFVYSAFGTDGLQSNFIAPMTNPWTPGAFGTRISAPTLPWETQAGKVNEGPVALQHGDRTWITYSASACWGDDYKIGALEYVGGDPLSAAAWRKGENPLFQRNDAAGVYAPGHHSFFTSPDGKETWIAYHANDRPMNGGGCGYSRTTRVQPITWNADGTPNLGVPLATSVRIPGPSGENASNAQRIRNQHSGLCLDDWQFRTAPGAEVRQFTCNDSAAQGWYLDHLEGDWYQLVNQHSGLCLDNYRFGTAPGAEVRQWTCNGNPVQQWRVSDAGNGAVTLTNRVSGLCLDDRDWVTTPGAAVQQWTCNGLPVQRWTIG